MRRRLEPHDLLHLFGVPSSIHRSMSGSGRSLRLTFKGDKVCYPCAHAEAEAQAKQDPKQYICAQACIYKCGRWWVWCGHVWWRWSRWV